tara:strand:- start:1332 stop:2579 length:1248 start_codon:yes stop_codon:yes gene_type:complete
VTIQEMHIAVNLGVQKLASFQVDNLLPQEIDHEINMAIRRFINQRYTPSSNRKQRGFEQSQKRIDDLRNLLEDYHIGIRVNDSLEKAVGSGSFFGTVYTSPVAGNIQLERFKLPLDYMYLINIKTTLFDGCHKPVEFDVNTKEERFLRIRVGTSQPGLVLRQIDIASRTGGLETIFSTLGNRNNYEDLLNPLLYAEGFKPSVSFQDGLADMFSELDVADSPIADSNEFFLRYPTSRPNANGDITTFVNFVTDNPDLAGAYAVVTYDHPFKELAGSDTAVEYAIFEAPYTSAKRFRTVTTKNNAFAQFKRTLCKSVQHDDIFALLDDPFNTAKASNVMYTMQENFVDLYSNNKTVPLGVTIKYLRKPISVNIGAGIGCELAEHTHHEIVEMTVKSILESFESPRYQTQSGEVLESE